MKRKNKKIWFDVRYNYESNRYLAKTPEGAVKQHFAHIGKPIPKVDKDDGGWIGVSVQPVDGYTRVVNVNDIFVEN